MIKLVEDALNEDAYLADVAGLHYSLFPEGLGGIEVRIDGFSHKLPLLVARVFGSLAAAAGAAGDKAGGGLFDAATFAREKEALVRKYRNANMEVGVKDHKHGGGQGGHHGRASSFINQQVLCG